MTALEFFQLVWPDTGWRCLATRKGKGLAHHWYTDSSDAAAAVEAFTADGVECWHGACTYLAASQRSQKNSAQTKCFYLDIDVGPDKPYVEIKAALLALRDFVHKTKLPIPFIVFSGAGLHVYWALTESVEASEVKVVGEKIKRLATHYGLAIDSTRTADSASLLRPVGGVNAKYDPARQVKAANAGVAYDPHQYRAAVELAAQVLPTLAARSKRNDVGVNSEFLTTAEYAESVADGVAGKCQQIQFFRDFPAQVDEPTWYAGICLLHRCKDGDEKIHEWSKAHPEYSKSLTDAKIKQAEMVGPTTCARYVSIRPNGCTGCQYAGKITSPITLGIERTIVTGPPVPAAEEAASEDDIIDFDATGFVECPFPFKRTPHGIFFPDESKGIDLLVYDYPLNLIDLAYDEHDKFEIAVVQHWLPQEGWKVFSFRSSVVASPKEFDAVMRDNHIKPVRSELLCTYIKAYMRDVQKAKKLRVMYSSMGWKDDQARFVLGKIALLADGTTEQAGISPRAGQALKGVYSKGELAAWTEAMRVFGMPGMQGHAFAFLAAFGSPILKFTGIPSACFSMVGPTGCGKTTVGAAMLSVWGDWNELKVNEGDTDTTKDTKMGSFSAIPQYIDETTNKDPKKVSAWLYQITQGRSKGRGQRDGSLQQTFAWNTIAVTSSNSSFAAKLGAAKINARAERVRLFEFVVNPNPYLNRDTAGRLHDAVAAHFGVAGEAFMRHVVTHQDDVRRGVRKMVQLIDGHTHAPDEERFISNSVGACLYGGWLAHKLGLIPFDIAPVLKWVLNTILAARGERVQGHSDEIEILGQYLNEFASARITIDDNRAYAHGEVGVERFQFGHLYARYEMRSGLLYVQRSHFAAWMVERGEDYTSLCDALRSRTILLGSVKKALGANTGVASSPVDCLKLDMRHPDVAMAIEVPAAAKSDAQAA